MAAERKAFPVSHGPPAGRGAGRTQGLPTDVQVGEMTSLPRPPLVPGVLALGPAFTAALSAGRTTAQRRATGTQSLAVASTPEAPAERCDPGWTAIRGHRRDPAGSAAPIRPEGKGQCSCARTLPLWAPGTEPFLGQEGKAQLSHSGPRGHCHRLTELSPYWAEPPSRVGEPQAPGRRVWWQV